MTNLFNGLHPSVEALSAYSDLSDLDRAQSRLHSHVATCAQCLGIVGEIRALGDEAREAPSAEMPEGLWARIEAAAAAPTPAVAPGLPVRSNSSRKGWLIGGLAVAAGLVALLVWPSRNVLEASGTSRLTFSPARPVPGGMLSVRYTPVPWLRGEPRLILVGRWLGATRGDELGYGDSLASLVPSAGGAYEARIKLPAQFNGVWLGVSDTAATQSDIDGWYPWLVMGGTRDGKPSLEAFLLASQFRQPYFVNEGYVGPRRSMQMFDAGDSLRRYFPKHPAGWAYAALRNGKASWLDRMVAFFQSSERKYMSFYEELWPQRNVSADRLHAMVQFAYTIQEPDEALRWARRYASEYPADPLALEDIAGALHQLELKEPPGLRDSIRPWLPVFEKMFQRDGGHIPNYEFLALVSRYADSGTVRLWEQRADSIRSFRYWQPVLNTDPLRRRSAEKAWTTVAARQCAREPRVYPFNAAFGDYTGGCERERLVAFSLLARAKLLDNEPRAALTFADSAQRIRPSFQTCGQAWNTSAVAARAAVSVGDTARALREAAQFGLYLRQPNAVSDSVRRWLGALAESPAFQSSVDSVRRVYESCVMQQKAKRDSLRRAYQSM